MVRENIEKQISLKFSGMNSELQFSRMHNFFIKYFLSFKFLYLERTFIGV